jgi:alkylation response protein AidB-like acyl-CoA dehydrogenase
MLWTTQAARIERKLEEIAALGEREAPGGGRLRDDPRFRDRVAALYVDGQALKFMGYRGFGKFARGEASPEHSVLKLVGSELEQQMCLVATEALGAGALDVSYDPRLFDVAEGAPPWSLQYLRSFCNTIAGGTSEIQRNIIAQRVLGLPRRR